MQWLALEKLINLHDGYRRLVQVNGEVLLLLQESGSCHLVGARCPHYGQSLEAASVSDGYIVCPMHGYRFSVENGRGFDGAGDRVSCALPIRGLEFRDNEVGLWL